MTEGKKAEYKNAIRSRQLIKSAYVALLNEKNVNKITVTDIINRAGISRGTFYAHYQDVKDLYNKLENGAVDVIIEIIENAGVVNFYKDPYPILEEKLLMIEKNKDYYRLLLSSCLGNSFSQKLSDRFAERFVSEIISHFENQNSDIIRAYVSFVSSGVRGMIFRWLDGTLTLSATQCAKIMTSMIIGAQNGEII